MRAKKHLDPKKVALAIAEAALDRKALEVEIIDVSGKVDYADYLVLASGSTDRHVQAIAESIESALEKKRTALLGTEGLPQAQWVLMDFGDVVAHIFCGELRTYYDLEGLWIDAQRIPVPGDGSARGHAPGSARGHAPGS
ncbi:MAG: ribosome silencing factor [Deltaproteobacteria bacterium]|nr:ribosome silencing factor [Deltaproteobacteria bacterium]